MLLKKPVIYEIGLENDRDVPPLPDKSEKRSTVEEYMELIDEKLDAGGFKHKKFTEEDIPEEPEEDDQSINRLALIYLSSGTARPLRHHREPEVVAVARRFLTLGGSVVAVVMPDLYGSYLWKKNIKRYKGIEEAVEENKAVLVRWDVFENDYYDIIAEALRKKKR